MRSDDAQKSICERLNPHADLSGSSCVRSSSTRLVVPGMWSIVSIVHVAVGSNIAVCPGEGPRYGDYRCNHDQTHRVCAQLVNGTTGAPLQWGTGDFWEITGQKAFQWSEQITSGANKGDSWCVPVSWFRRLGTASRPWPLLCVQGGSLLGA